MPFRKENRYGTFLILSIILYTATVGWVLSRNKVSVELIVLLGIGLKLLLSQAQQHFNSKRATEDRQEIKEVAATSQRQAVHDIRNDLGRVQNVVAEAVVKAKKEPCPDQEVMPRTREELRCFMGEVARTLCPDIAAEIKNDIRDELRKDFDVLRRDVLEEKRKNAEALREEIRRDFGTLKEELIRAVKENGHGS